MTLVVSDTSPIRALSHLGLVHLLPAMYGVVWVPPAVVRELANPRGAFPSIDAAGIGLLVRAPTDAARVAALARDLDPGESEAIALAIETGADLLLVDEYEGREIATELGLRIKGVLGVLVDARAAGHVAKVRPLIDRLRTEINFHVRRGIRDQILESAGEGNDDQP